jgi:opacity protein-like surface antigen
MKKILLLLCMLITYSLSFAQVEKGKWFAAGHSSLRLDVGKVKYETNGEPGSEYKNTNFNFDPMVGYFVIDKLPVGLYFDVYTHKEIATDDNDTYKEREIVLGPFARYYIKQFDKFIPFGEARVGFGKYKDNWYDEDEFYEESVFTYRIGAGASYFFTENVALDAFIGYDYDGYTDKSGDTDETYIYSSVEINFGLVVTFGKQ